MLPPLCRHDHKSRYITLVHVVKVREDLFPVTTLVQTVPLMSYCKVRRRNRCPIATVKLAHEEYLRNKNNEIEKSENSEQDLDEYRYRLYNCKDNHFSPA